MAHNCIAHIVANNLLADTHSHLHSDHFSNEKLPQVFARAIAAGVAEIWLMSIDEQSAWRNCEILKLLSENLAEKLKLRLSLGFDMELLVPGSDLFSAELFKLTEHEISTWVREKLTELKKTAETQDLVVDLIGEIGLDHYWLSKSDLPATEIAHSQALQAAMFKTQLEFASECGLPVSIHSRAAEDICIEVVAEFKREHELTAIFHSFTGSAEQIRTIQSLGCYLGVNGIITYNSAQELKQSIRSSLITEPKSSELERGYSSKLLLETDAPYLIPSNANRAELKQAYGEAINEPAQVRQILAKLF